MSLLGADFSHWNGVVNWEKVKADGNVFAFAKCSEGSTVSDEQYAANVAGAKAHGILFGAYHFFRASQDPMSQVDLFLRKIGHTDLPPVLDWEVSDGMRNQIQIQRASIWLKAVQQALGKTPLIYGGPSFLGDLALPESFAAYPLWVAHYGVPAPRIPKPWTSWTFWQSSDGNGQDIDQFAGTLDNLNKLV